MGGITTKLVNLEITKTFNRHLLELPVDMAINYIKSVYQT